MDKPSPALIWTESLSHLPQVDTDTTNRTPFPSTELPPPHLRRIRSRSSNYSHDRSSVYTNRSMHSLPEEDKNEKSNDDAEQLDLDASTARTIKGLPLIRTSEKHDPGVPFPSSESCLNLTNETTSHIRYKAYPRFRVNSSTTSSPTRAGSGLSTSSRPTSILIPFSPSRERRQSSGSTPTAFSPSSPLFSPSKLRRSVLSVRSGDDKSSEEIVKKSLRAAKALKVVQEICETEERFASGLKMVQELFLDPITAAAETDNPILSTTQIKQLFGNIREIHTLSQQTSQALRQCLTSLEGKTDSPFGHVLPARQATSRLQQIKHEKDETPPLQQTLTRSSSAPALFQADFFDTPRISHVLLSHLPYLSLYYPYITAFPTIPGLLDTLRTTNSRFTSFVKKKEQDPRCGNLSLSHWLLTIIQRIPRWTMLIDSLIRATDDLVEKQALKRALEMSETVTRNINTRLKDQTAAATLVNLQKAFSGLTRPLVAPARRLMKKGVLTQTAIGSSEIWLFLFNDILICAKAATGMSMTSTTLSAWIYNAEGSLASFALSMSHALTPSVVAGSELKRSHQARPQSIIEDSFDCTDWIEVEDINVFALDSERDTKRRERAFQFTSPLTSMELLGESRADKDSWLMALNEAKYARLADLQTIQQTPTIRRAKRSSLHGASRRSSSSLFDGSQYDVIEVDGYNAPVINEGSKNATACALCKTAFSILKSPYPCHLACGQLYCSDCVTHTFVNTVDPIKRTKTACKACFDSVFHRSATSHEVLDSPSSFTLSRNVAREPVEMLTSVSSKTIVPATEHSEEGRGSEDGPSEAVKVLRELLERSAFSP